MYLHCGNSFNFNKWIYIYTVPNIILYEAGQITVNVGQFTSPKHRQAFSNGRPYTLNESYSR